MIYTDFPSIVKRITEVKEYKIQLIIASLGIFLSLLVAALFEGKFSLIVEGITITTLGILVLISKRSLVNISGNGSMGDVDGVKAIRWGVYYLFFGFILFLFYFLI